MGDNQVRSISIGDVLSTGFSVCFQSFILFLAISILSQIFPIINQVINIFFPAQENPVWGVPMIIFAILGIILSIWGSLALTYAIAQKYQGEMIEVRDAFFKGAKGKFFRYFFAGLLYGIVIMGGFVLLVIPGLYFMAIFCLAPIIIVIEESGVIDSFQRSADMVKGNFWKVFLLIILTMILTMIAMILSGIIGAILGEAIQGLVGLILGIALMPIYTSISVVLYYHLLEARNYLELAPEEVSS